MALVKTTEGEHWHTAETGRNYGIGFHLYESDNIRDGFAVAIVTQLPESAPIQEISAELKERVQEYMEDPDSPLIYIEHYPPDSPEQNHRYFIAESDAREEINEATAAFYIAPHPLEKDLPS